MKARSENPFLIALRRLKCYGKSILSRIFFIRNENWLNSWMEFPSRPENKTRNHALSSDSLFSSNSNRNSFQFVAGVWEKQFNSNGILYTFTWKGGERTILIDLRLWSQLSSRRIFSCTSPANADYRRTRIIPTMKSQRLRNNRWNLSLIDLYVFV